MNIKRSTRFMARFRRLSRAEKQAVIDVIEVFRDDPLTPALNNHALHGRMARQRSLSVDHDLRIIFTVRGDDDEVLFLDIGTHTDVYHR